MKSILCSLLVIAACGGSSKPANNAPPPVDPVPMPEAKAPDPVEPAEPAPPEPDPAAEAKAELLAAETAAFEKAKPAFGKWCAHCHTKDGKKTSAKKLEEFDMTSYPFASEHGMEIAKEIREVLGLSGKRATMPADKKGAVKGADLEAIKAWADAFDASHAGGAHEGHGGGHGGHH